MKETKCSSTKWSHSENVRTHRFERENNAKMLNMCVKLVWKFLWNGLDITWKAMPNARIVFNHGIIVRSCWYRFDSFLLMTLLLSCCAFQSRVFRLCTDAFKASRRKKLKLWCYFYRNVELYAIDLHATIKMVWKERKIQRHSFLFVAYICFLLTESKGDAGDSLTHTHTRTQRDVARFCWN